MASVASFKRTFIGCCGGWLLAYLKVNWAFWAWAKRTLAARVAAPEAMTRVRREKVMCVSLG